MKYLLISVLLFNINSSYCQEKLSNLKIGLGSSFFNINENFDDIFLFNNSSPIIIGLKGERLRLESTTNISLSTRENNSTFVRGSIRLSLDYFSEISSKMKICSVLTFISISLMCFPSKSTPFLIRLLKANVKSDFFLTQ